MCSGALVQTRQPTRGHWLWSLQGVQRLQPAWLGSRRRRGMAAALYLSEGAVRGSISDCQVAAACSTVGTQTAGMHLGHRIDSAVARQGKRLSQHHRGNGLQGLICVATAFIVPSKVGAGCAVPLRCSCDSQAASCADCVQSNTAVWTHTCIGGVASARVHMYVGFLYQHSGSQDKVSELAFVSQWGVCGAVSYGVVLGSRCCYLGLFMFT